MSNTDAYSDVNAVRDATDLVQLVGEHVALRPKGREHVGLCPFHDDRTPSFAVVTHKGNAFYKCHACGAGGDAFDFVRNYHKMDFPEALRYLAERAGITLKPRKRHADAAAGCASDGSGGYEISASDLREANALAAAFYRKVFQSPQAGVGREICAQRGISDEMIDAFGIGLAPDQWDALHTLIRKRNLPERLYAAAGLLKARTKGDGFYDAFRNRLIFPICNDVGLPVAFGARKINPEDEPKYLNSAESAIFQKSRTLYGLHLAKRAIIDAKQVIVTEGYTDVIACHQAGVTNVVGTLGTALTRLHAKMLARLCDTVVLLFDGDDAGQRAADRALEVFFAEPVDVKICILPDGVDPDDLLKREAGAATLRSLVAQAEDAMAFKINRFRDSLADVAGISGKQKHFEQFMRDLAGMGFGLMQGVRRRMVITQLADLLGVSTRDIEQAIPAVRHNQHAQHVHSDDAGSDDAGETMPQGAGVSINDAVTVAPARRRAEHDLLAIILYEPSVVTEPIVHTGVDGKSLAATVTCEDFADTIARRIATDVFACIQRGEAFTMQQLLMRHDEPRIKNVLTSLYLDGRRICGDSRSQVMACLAEAVQTLQGHMHREQYRESVTAFRRNKPASGEAIEAVCQLLEERRKQPLMADAISHAARR